MARTPGLLGSCASLWLRLGQASFSAASLIFMSVGVEFYSYTPFCFLVAIMGLLIPWSCTFAMVDLYSIILECHIRQPAVIVVVIVGDWAFSMMSLAAACSTTSSIGLLLEAKGPYCTPSICSRYQLSAVMAFFSWILITASSLTNLWDLASG